jgi:hypothetical protein
MGCGYMPHGVKGQFVAAGGMSDGPWIAVERILSGVGGRRSRDRRCDGAMDRRTSRPVLLHHISI